MKKNLITEFIKDFMLDHLPWIFIGLMLIFSAVMVINYSEYKTSEGYGKEIIKQKNI